MNYGIITMNVRLPVGIVTFGNLKYTKITYDSLLESTNIDLDIAIVVGKPNDTETINWAVENDISMASIHSKNKGFPASINDIYDYFWGGDSQLPLVILGNDIVVYPGAVDRLYTHHILNDADWVSATESFTPETFIEEYPSASKFFTSDFELDKYADFRFITDLYKRSIESDVHDLSGEKIIGDSHNMCLFSRKLFDTIGYIDVNFYPAYFEDNDYSRRAILSNKLKMVKLGYANYFHFWSRTIYEEGMKKTNDKYFPMNKKYYKRKWGGEPGKETEVGNVGIFTREREKIVLDFWRSR